MSKCHFPNLGIIFSLLLLVASDCMPVAAEERPADRVLKVGYFDIDATPPIGAPLAYDPCVGVDRPLSFRGIVLLGAGEPIVLAAVDWIGIANEAHTEVRRRLAEAVGTQPDRVAVHALHQHDAPRADFTSAALLAHHGVNTPIYDVPWARDVFQRAGAAAKEAAAEAVPVDRIGLGAAEVDRVASNRRLMDEDGKVFATRYTACRDPKLREMPTGTIDPLLRAISFYSGEKPVVVLTYYATHPQSYYRTGLASPDFPGYARQTREEETGVPHIHFNGAGGNIGAGKWNDGAKENREVLAGRVADGMKRAWESSQQHSIMPRDVAWRSVSVALPPGEHLDESELVSRLEQSDVEREAAAGAARHLAWLRRSRAGDQVDVSCLALGPARMLHMPGELFVEYQLSAAEMRPDLFVAMAAYGDYGPGYIGTEIAYSQGGYETSDRASRVAPAVEGVLQGAMAELLRGEETPPSGKR